MNYKNNLEIFGIRHGPCILVAAKVGNMRTMEKRAMSSKARIVNLTEKNFHHEVLESELPVIVKFGADWLATCDIMAPIINDLCIDYNGRVKFGSVDIDISSNLVKSFGVSNLPAFVFFKDGQAVDHIVGAAPKNVFVTKITKLFQHS